MARKAQRLSVKSAAAKKLPGYYADGAGLCLQVSASGSKSWIFRFMIAGRAREMGLGSFATVSLAEARGRAAAQRTILHEGRDPIEARDAEKRRRAVENARSITFDECAAAFIKAHRAGWKNAKHGEQWTNTLATYAEPVLRGLPVQAIETAHVMKVLEPIWSEKSETASRVRARIEKVLDWATARNYRIGDNPARWRGHLDKLLPKLSKKQRVRHHPALPFDEVGPFMVALRALDGVAPPALEFTILTCARTGEVLGATPKEFEISKRVWTIPAGRMKGGVEHRVPLSTRAAEIVRSMTDTWDSEFVFPGQREKRPLSNMALLQVLQERLGREDLTVHGFRSTFRDWAAERTNYSRDVCEMALAHVISDETEAAYRRGDLFEKRRRLMDEWSQFCDQPARRGAQVPPPPVGSLTRRRASTARPRPLEALVRPSFSMRNSPKRGDDPRS